MLKFTSRIVPAGLQRTALNCQTSVATYANFPHPPSDPEEKPLTPLEQKIADAKTKLKWRQPLDENKNEWYTKFKVFAPEKNEDTDMIAFLQQPIDLTLKGRRERKERKRVHVEKFMQQFVPERHQILGNDLAAAHFLVHRGGSVKFVGQPKWVKATENLEYSLPSKYDSGWLIEAIRCDDMELYYDGLENVRRLNSLKFLSFHNVKPFDDWCLDRVSGSEFSALEVLDLSGTQVTERGLCALYRIPSLKVLILDDAQANKTCELTCALLQELMPELKVSNASQVH